MELDTILFQSVFDELSVFFPSNWEESVILLKYWSDAYQFSFYVLSGTQFLQCYDLPGISEDDLLDAFSRIDTLLLAVRKQQHAEWTSMTITVAVNGNTHVYYDYTPQISMDQKWKENWENQYLIPE